MPSSDWFYVQDRQKVGPVTKEALRSLFEQGTVSDEDLVWTQGMSEWKPAGQVQARFGVKPISNASPDQPHEAGMDPALDMEAPSTEPAADVAREAAYDVGEGLGIERSYAPTTEHEFASFGSRVGAFLIDGLIVFAINVVVMLISFVAIFFVGSLMANTSVGEALLVVLMLGMYGLMIAVPWLYYARQESGMKMATIGKRVVGIQVIDTDGYPVSFLRATGRYFSKYLISSLICGMGYFFPLFTEKKQALHDLIAATLVVKAKA